MFSFAKFVGLMAAVMLIPIVLAANVVDTNGLAHHEVGGYANGLVIDSMNIAGRQAGTVTTVTTTVTLACGPGTGTATETNTVSTGIPASPPGTTPSSTTPVPSMSSSVNTIPATGEATTTPAASTPASTTLPGETPVGTASLTSSESTPTEISSVFPGTSITVTPLSPTGPQSSTTPTSTGIHNTGGAGLIKFDVIGALAAAGVAAIAVY